MRQFIVKKKKTMGTPEKPRLNVYRSLYHIYAQIIDDTTGTTKVAFSSLSLKLKNGGNIAAAQKVGQALAQAAIKAGIKKVFFDRNGFLYHGRIAALAKAAREGGLEF